LRSLQAEAAAAAATTASTWSIWQPQPHQTLQALKEHNPVSQEQLCVHCCVAVVYQRRLQQHLPRDGLSVLPRWATLPAINFSPEAYADKSVLS
jgi:hypothetical protein